MKTICAWLHRYEFVRRASGRIGPNNGNPGEAPKLHPSQLRPPEARSTRRIETTDGRPAAGANAAQRSRM
jgi:hypothetical protein